MAFNYFTIDSVKNIDASDIPEAFINYYQNLSDEMKEALKDIRPDLIEAMGGDEENSDTDEHDNSVSDSAIVLQVETESEVDDEDSEDDVDDEGDSPIIEEWESISVRAWQNSEIESSVLVCKVIPDHISTCRIHRIPLKKKQIKIKHDNGATYGVLGKWCPECMDFYVDQNKADAIINKLDMFNIPAWIQPLEDTLAEWKENGTPIELKNDTPIYVPDTWVEGHYNCPIHPEEILIEDSYQKSYKDRHVSFEAYYCNKCKKIIMRNSLAQKLDDDCGEIGIPEIEFIRLRNALKQEKTLPKLRIKPDYFIQDGEIERFSYYTFSDDDYWEQLTEDDTVVINDSRSCIEDDHETENLYVLIKVQEKRSGLRVYAVQVGYCDECEKYYIAKEDFDCIAGKGRLLVSLIDETGTFNKITSGNTFEQEKTHLDTLEKRLDCEIDSIQNSPGFVSKYAVGDYDDGELSFAKHTSAPLYKKIDQLADYKSIPYGYRTDLTYGDKTITYYLGAEDIDLDNTRQVISFNSDLGRKMVNYRTLDLMMQGTKWKVKRRRTFEIDRAILYSFTEQSDEDLIFRSGITDLFLINVLNMRKKQHQLIDIISTIQENQNAIIDYPFKKNLIVQGCAGSGKTMILLHRLSALKYNNTNFNFDNAVILTPSKNFNTHISGLASSLQLGHIDRYCIEDYYYMLLRKYNDSFELRNPISDEMNVNQIYVDFIYSDEFKTIINEIYENKLNELKGVSDRVKEISEAIHRQDRERNNTTDSGLVEYLLKEIRENSIIVSIKDENYENAVNKLTKFKDNKDTLSIEINEAEEALKITLNANGVNASITLNDILITTNKRINEFSDQIAEKENEYEALEERRVAVRKKLRLSNIQNEIDSLREQQSSLIHSNERLQDLMNTDYKAMSQEEKIGFLNNAGRYSSQIRANNDSIQKQMETIQSKREELKAVDAYIQEAEDSVNKASQERIPETLKENIQNLSEWSSGITVKKIYEDIYKAASERANDVLEKRTGKRYRRIQGTHRYDLYLQLLFAIRYFGKSIGNNTFICIDEGQDLAPNEYRLITQINNNKAILNIYGDTNQLLKKRGISDWTLVSDIVHSDKPFVLNENYRNTNQITQFCNDTFNMNVSLTGVDGHSVKEISRVRLESTLANLKRTEERIALILPRSANKDDYIYYDQLPQAIKSVIGADVGNGKITMAYVDEVKGVEFDRVFVVPNSMTKNEKYIAYTRALSNLTIVYDDSLNVKIEEPVKENNPNDNKENSTNSEEQVKQTGSITIGKVNTKRNVEEIKKREKLRSRFRILDADITKIKADAIVSSYSKSKHPGKLRTSIFNAAGKNILKELRYVSDISIGNVCVTGGYKLPCKYVIHAYSPHWSPENEAESEKLLKLTYQNIMKCAIENKVKTIAIPSLSTGFNGFPKRKAAYIALSTVSEFVKEHLEQLSIVAFIVHSKDEADVFNQLLLHIGKDNDARINLSNCIKCNKRIRMRKRNYDKYVVNGFVPSYCGSCSKEVYEQRACTNCGITFDVTYGEKDRCEQTGEPIPNICPKCKNKRSATDVISLNHIEGIKDNNPKSDHSNMNFDNNVISDPPSLSEEDRVITVYGECEGSFILHPYEGKLKYLTEKKVATMFIPLTVKGKTKKVPVSVVEEDRIIYITKNTLIAFREILLGAREITLSKK